MHYPRLLSIAGSDSGGGAGIQADLKTWSALGCYGMTAITAITAQNTVGVRAIHGVPVDILRAQIHAVAHDIGVDAVKIGMLHSIEVMEVVAEALTDAALRPVVLDPVMVATSGDRLMQPDAVAYLVQKLFPVADIITPNLDEASLLLGRQLQHENDLAPAAHALLNMGARAVLIKGGHLQGDHLVDVLAVAGQPPLVWTSARIASKNVHGTGCTLSSAVAAYLALGLPLVKAVEQARMFVRHAIEAGKSAVTGAGHGPLNHGFAPLTLQARSG